MSQTIIFGALSVFALVVALTREFAKASPSDRADRRRWRASVYLGCVLLSVNIAVEIGRRVSESSREVTARQQKLDEMKHVTELREDLRTLTVQTQDLVARLGLLATELP